MTDDEIRGELAALGRALADNTKAVNDLTVVILGKDGQGGCFRSHTQLAKDFYSFKRRVLVIFAFMAGGGGVTVGAIEILNRLVK